MNKEEIFSKVQKAIDAADWISPEWEPWAKCADNEKEQFVLFCNLISQFAPTSLGAIVLTFEKLSPHRQFIWYDKEAGQDPHFLSNLLESLGLPDNE